MKPTWSGVLVVVALLFGSCGKDKVATESSDAVAPEPIHDLTVAGARSFSLSLLWTATGDDGVSGQATAYDVRYATEPITMDNWGACRAIDGEPDPSEPGV